MKDTGQTKNVSYFRHYIKNQTKPIKPRRKDKAVQERKFSRQLIKHGTVSILLQCELVSVIG